jgi:hypothetical protein
MNLPLHKNVMLLKSLIYLAATESKHTGRIDDDDEHNSRYICRRTGGSLLITDMARSSSMFDLIPHAEKIVRDKIDNEGSQLGRVLARCAWNVE